MEYWGVGICLRKRVRREQVLGAGDPTVRRAIPFGPRKKAFSGTCRCPHRKVTLAQCRIRFQPVSPDHRTTGRPVENQVSSPHGIGKVYRSKEVR